jgi:PhnB protein
MADHIPEGFHTITPYPVVKDAARLLEFLRAAFDAEELGRHADAEGRIMHAAVRIGDSVLEMGEPRPGDATLPSSLHMYVPDVDAVYARAVAAGGESLYAPDLKPYGDREAGVRDPGGNLWYIATRQAQVEAAGGASAAGAEGHG